MFDFFFLWIFSQQGSDDDKTKYDFGRFCEVIRSNDKVDDVSEMVRVFERYDLNDSGELSRKEVTAWFESMGMCNQVLESL